MGRSRRRALIRPASKHELPAIAGFVATLQAQPEHRIGYLGETADEIEALLASWDKPWHESGHVVQREGHLAGFATAELDVERGRAWIHGPFVDDPEWDELADLLLGEVAASAPPTVDDFELVGDVANVKLAALAERHAFTAGAVRALDALQRIPYAKRVVSSEDEAALGLYDSLGFTRESSLVGYRRRPEVRG